MTKTEFDTVFKSLEDKIELMLTLRPLRRVAFHFVRQQIIDPAIKKVEEECVAIGLLTADPSPVVTPPA